MKPDPAHRHRRSIRLPGYDYSYPGAYFITICTQNRQFLFGDIAGGTMQLNDAGRMVERCWDEIPTHFPNVQLDEFTIMPNHIHGIVVINDFSSELGAKPCVGAKNFSPLQGSLRQPLHPPLRQPLNPPHQPHGTSKTIGSVIRGFKIGVTKWMRQHTLMHEVWQRNYWEHIIRDEPELNRIREYISNNPATWDSDTLHNENRQGDN